MPGLDGESVVISGGPAGGAGSVQGFCEPLTVEDKSVSIGSDSVMFVESN